MAGTSEVETDPEKAAYIRRWQEQIQAMLTAVGQRQAWLVRKAGIDQTTVSKWMNGSRGPNIHQLGKVAKAFDLTLEQLMDWTPVKGVSQVPAQTVISHEKIPARLEAYLAPRPNWLSGDEREAFVAAVKAVSAVSPGLDLTDQFLHQIGQSIKFGYAMSGQF